MSQIKSFPSSPVLLDHPWYFYHHIENILIYGNYPNKLDSSMVIDRTIIITESSYNNYMDNVKKIQDYDPVRCIEIIPQYEINKSNDKWYITLLKGKKIYAFEELKDLTTEEVVEYFSLVDVKQVIVKDKKTTDTMYTLIAKFAKPVPDNEKVNFDGFLQSVLASDDMKIKIRNSQLDENKQIIIKN
jgi:hypothetical protein